MYLHIQVTNKLPNFECSYKEKPYKQIEDSTLIVQEMEIWIGRRGKNMGKREDKAGRQQGECDDCLPVGRDLQLFQAQFLN